MKSYVPRPYKVRAIRYAEDGRNREDVVKALYLGLDHEPWLKDEGDRVLIQPVIDGGRLGNPICPGDWVVFRPTASGMTLSIVMDDVFHRQYTET